MSDTANVVPGNDRETPYGATPGVERWYADTVRAADPRRTPVSPLEQATQKAEYLRARATCTATGQILADEDDTAIKLLPRQPPARPPTLPDVVVTDNPWRPNVTKQDWALLHTWGLLGWSRRTVRDVLERSGYDARTVFLMVDRFAAFYPLAGKGE